VSDEFQHPISIQIIRLLREEREQRGLSMYVLAKRSGLSQPMIGYVERGLRNPTLETILRMADALELDFAELVTRAQATVATKRPK
jgi:transcriptional regulator with XRE-family HTH domain